MPTNCNTALQERNSAIRKNRVEIMDILKVPDGPKKQAICKKFLLPHLYIVVLSYLIHRKRSPFPKGKAQGVMIALKGKL